ncbi:MAG: 3-deoxy-D-manno-octulosonic acid transferase [Rhodoblastus sp.]
MTAALLLYRTAGRLLEPLAPRFLARRAAQDREDVSRLAERMGRARIARPAGPLVWLHGASIGEGLALLPLIEAIARSGAHALATTGTATSARVVGDRLPPGAIHQFVPLDGPSFARRFLDHWRPDAAIFAESEIWPNLILETRRRGAPLFLVNARMSERSVERWRRAPATARELLGAFERIFAQGAQDAARFESLGAPRVTISGNLKYDVAPPPARPEELAQFSAALGGRPVWVAASTHEGEEEFCLAAHSILRLRFPDLMTIVAPRNARRGRDIAGLARTTGARTALRSAGETISRDCDVFVADTFGEMGLWYRLASIVFVGKSLVAGGGQNPIEPAKLGAAILHGPDVDNFVDAYAMLDASGGGACVHDATELAGRLAALFADPAQARAMARAAAATVERLSGATRMAMQAVEPILARGAAT